MSYQEARIAALEAELTKKNNLLKSVVLHLKNGADTKSVIELIEERIG